MNPTQITTTATPIIAFLAGLAAGRGLFGWDQATWLTVLTGVVGFGATIWAAIATRKTALVSTVAALPEVKTVTLEATPAGTAMAQATPVNVEVSPK